MVGDQRPFETLLKGKANWQGAGGKVRNNWQGDHGVSVISNFLRLDRVETRPQSQITISGIKRSNSLFIKFVDFGISSCNLYFRFKQMNRSEGSLEHAKLAQASKGFRRVRVVKLWAVLKAHFKIGNPDFPHQSFPNCLGVGSFTRRLPPPPPMECLETFSLVTRVEGSSTGIQWVVLPNILQCMGLPPQQRTAWSKIGTILPYCVSLSHSVQPGNSQILGIFQGSFYWAHNNEEGGAYKLFRNELPDFIMTHSGVNR